ncbi:hypothetical protein QBC46DRAFT_26899 [Diplogelasinospora grovesii]|uniref:Uncharacterized protein n=1 Tax=Diplogelasinospora grovesii TaxID=303347 RepID=A0AAN6NEF8_9PEZI|nr:hypothetical protein QBC46DRAFT_26899 [Diplogelasinospora grovesii]
MRFTALLLTVAGLALGVSAQTTTDSAPSATSSEQAAILACLNACDAGDVACRAKCIAVPNPDTAQVNATNQCVAACPQGNGTKADNEDYSNCVEGCIGKYYYTSSGTPAGATGAAGGSGASGSAGATGVTATGSASGTAATQTGSASGSATGTGAAASTSRAAGDVLHVAGSAAGLLGFLAAFLAL